MDFSGFPQEETVEIDFLYKWNFPERLRGYAVAKMIIPCVFPCSEMQPTKLSLGYGYIYMLMPVNVNFLILRLHLCLCVQY